MQKVVVVGAAVVDILFKSRQLKVSRGSEIPGGLAICEVVGSKVEAEESMVASGGGGVNVAVGLHRLGEAVKLVSRVGDDSMGELLRHELEREGLDLSLLQKGEGKTGLSVVLISSDGGRSIVTSREESGRIDSGEIQWEMVERADWLQISSLGEDETLLEDLVNFAFARGVRIGLNPGKRELQNKERLLKLLPKVDLLSINQVEVSSLLGLEGEERLVIAREAMKLGPRVLAITEGREGASIIVNNRMVSMRSFPVSSIDDTGAGDAFVSGVVAGILHNVSYETSLKMGIANGASEVTRMGAKSGLLDKSEMQKWLKKRLLVVEEYL